MKSTIVFLSVISFTFVSPKIHKRALCTVTSSDDPSVDDVPAITEALQGCGDTGTILLPANQTFQIRSSIDLSPCRICSFQIDGLLRVSSDWDYWKKQTAVFTLANSANAIIHSDNKAGIIDGNNFGWTGDGSLLHLAPILFDISHQSSQVYIRNLQLMNIPATAFHVSSGSSAVRIDSIDFQTPAATGYLIEQAQHVYVWNNTIRATGSCISILPNSSNVQIETSTCITTGTSSTQSGFELQFGLGTGPGWIRNVFIKAIKVFGSMNVVSFLTGSGEAEPHPVEINNATFTDIVLEGRVRKAVKLEEGQNTLIAQAVTFQDFHGEVLEASDLKCSASADVCDIKAKDWDVVVIQD
jgi:hypothetical protein